MTRETSPSSPPSALPRLVQALRHRSGWDGFQSDAAEDEGEAEDLGADKDRLDPGDHHHSEKRES